MIRRHRITTLTQHRTRLLIGAVTYRSDSARTGHLHQITQTTLLQLLSEQHRSHHRSSAIEAAYKRDMQSRATHNWYRFPSSESEVIGSGIAQINYLSSVRIGCLAVFRWQHKR